ncbi:MAG TPA: VWA domain-containing protein [Candidatus Acidoferrales bacterium]|jgi:Ca-activated chloride channel family protein|nr:VWA domain-containing protein [Candidatus Acidoferrales bacterium]
MKRAIATLCTFALVSFAALADVGVSDPQQQQQRQKGPIRVQTDLVSVLASVTDDKGEPVIGLAQSAFQLSEEGIAQKIVRFEPQTNRPLDLALMLDASGSAAIELKIEREAAAHFIEEVVRPTDRLAVFSFAADVVQLCNFSADLKQLDSAVRRVDTSPDMGTSLYDAVVLGSQSVRRQGAERRRALVIITDAGETTSVSKFEDARRAAIASNILLYTVVVRPMKSDAGWNTAGEHAISTITDSVGGAMYYPTNLSELGEIFDRINRELRTQYLLGYYPNPTPPPGSDRHVVVSVNTGDTVRYRKEYFTAGVAQ